LFSKNFKLLSKAKSGKVFPKSTKFLPFFYEGNAGLPGRKKLDLLEAKKAEPFDPASSPHPMTGTCPVLP
jgi:hypothetical protein